MNKAMPKAMTRHLFGGAMLLATSLALGQQAPEVAARPSPGPANGARYLIDPLHTFVMYEIGHYGASTNRGRFSTKSGSVQIDGNGRGGQVDIVIDISSVNTGVDLLNRHLQSSDFFNVAEYPTGRFVAGQLVLEGDRVREVQGALTLMGRTHPITLRANRFACYESPLLRRQVCGGDFETTIERSRWGIEWGLSVGFEDKVRLLVQVEGVLAR